MPSEAQAADFLGETAQGGFDTGIEGRAPDATAEDVAEMLRRKKEWMASQGLDLDGNPLPALGTPVSEGGTASGHQVTVQPRVGTGAMQVVTDVPLGANGVPDVGGQIRETTTQVAGDVPRDAAGNPIPTIRDETTGTVAPDISAGPGGFSGGTSRGSTIVAQTSQETQQLRDKLAADQQLATDELRGTLDDAANMNPLTNRALTQTAANQATSALGPAPTIDQGMADRGMRAVTDATRQAGQVVDAALSPVNQQPVMQATQSARDVLDRALNGPDTTARIGSQVIRNQLALARSAGTAGQAQAALSNAQAMAPELQAQAAQSATQEQLQKLGVASQQTGQLAQTALGQQQNENQRLDVAGKAAGVSAQAAQGARGQDIEIAKANQGAAQNLMNNIAQLTGQQLQLNQQNQELLGQMARDLAQQNFNWSQLDANAQDAEFERWVKTYGIDVAAAAQIKAAAANNDKGVMDYLMPIIGGVASGLL